MKKVKIFLSTLFIGLSFNTFTHKAYSMIFDEHIYGRARAYIGIATQYSLISGETDKKVSNTGLLLGVGYHLHFNIYDNLHPFVGFELQGIAPFQDKKYNSYQYYDKLVASRYYKEVFLMHFKFGTKFVINDTFAVSPYALVGMNVARIETKVEDLTKANNVANISVGLGGELTINNFILLALEYRYSESDKHITKINNHNVALKLGLEFL